MSDIPASFDPAEYLAEARGHLERNPKIPERHYSLRLLAAVEAVRKLVDEWEVLAPWLGRPAANAIREVISHELLGDDDSEPPRTETDCPCDDDCPCDAGRYGAACACCVAGDHDGSCASRALLGEGEDPGA